MVPRPFPTLYQPQRPFERDQSPTIFGVPWALHCPFVAVLIEPCYLGRASLFGVYTIGPYYLESHGPSTVSPSSSKLQDNVVASVRSRYHRSGLEPERMCGLNHKPEAPFVVPINLPTPLIITPPMWYNYNIVRGFIIGGGGGVCY